MVNGVWGTVRGCRGKAEGFYFSCTWFPAVFSELVFMPPVINIYI